MIDLWPTPNTNQLNDTAKRGKVGALPPIMGVRLSAVVDNCSCISDIRPCFLLDLSPVGDKFELLNDL